MPSTKNDATGDIVDLGNARPLGGKAAGLADLKAAGEHTPPGFVIPHGRVDELTAADLGRWLERLSAPEVAIRSSGTEEDGAVASQAGAHATVLGVARRADDVMAAVRKVHSSGERVSVIVQQMADAATSGVAFTVNPVTGDEETVITAVPGTAGALMAGEVEGQTWTCRDDGIHGEGDLLSSTQLRAVADAASRLRAGRGRHVDIEWAIDRSGALVLLQCRPVTAVPVAPRIEVPAGPWEKDVTHSPGPLSPMTCSLEFMSEALIADWAERFGLIVKTIRIAYIGGEEYSQVVPLIGKPSTASPPPWWVLGALSRVVPALRRRMATASSVIDSGELGHLVERWWGEWRPDFAEHAARLRAADPRDLDDGALKVHTGEALALLRRGTRIHFDLFIPYLVDVHAFIRAAGDLLGWSDAKALAALKGSSPESAEPARRMAAIAAEIRARPDVMAAVEGADDVVESVRSSAPDLAAKIDEWEVIEGYRVTDYDVAAPSIAEIPGLSELALRGALMGARATGASETHAAVDDALSRLGLAERARFEEVFDKARETFGIREDNVHLTTIVPMTAIRMGLLEIGRRLADRGALPAPDDIMMLSWEEALDAFTGRAPSDLAGLARRRAAELAWVRAHPGPLHHGGEPGQLPDLRGLPTSGRVINEALLWAISTELKPAAPAETDGLAGAPCGPGSYTGPARVVLTESGLGQLEPGEVLVCPIATPAWSAVFGAVGAVVCDGGGPLSHTAVIAREHGVPTVMGTGSATAEIADGDLIEVNGTDGRVLVVERR